MTALDELKYEVNCAAMEAMDDKLTELLGTKTFIRDKLLPQLLPALERATLEALRDVYQYLPEHFAAHDEIREAVRSMHKAMTPKELLDSEGL